MKEGIFVKKISVVVQYKRFFLLKISDFLFSDLIGCQPTYTPEQAPFYRFTMIF